MSETPSCGGCKFGKPFNDNGIIECTNHTPLDLNGTVRIRRRLESQQHLEYIDWMMTTMWHFSCNEWEPKPRQYRVERKTIQAGDLILEDDPNPVVAAPYLFGEAAWVVLSDDA